MASPLSSYSIPNPHDHASPFVFINIINAIKLTFENYLSWKLQIQAILVGHGLQHFIDGSTPPPPPTIQSSETVLPNPEYTTWVRQDQLLFGALIGTLSPNIVPLVSSAKISKDIWDILAKIYATPSRGHIKQLKDKLRKIAEGTSIITKYMNSIKTLTDQLASLGKPVDHEDIIERVLEGLDASYASVVSAVNSRDTPICFEELHEKLINAELLVEAPPSNPLSNPATTFAAQYRSSSNRTNPRNQPPLLPTPPSTTTKPKPFLGCCQWCCEKGHVVTQYSTFLRQYPTPPSQATTTQNYFSQAHATQLLSSPSSCCLIVVPPTMLLMTLLISLSMLRIMGRRNL